MITRKYGHRRKCLVVLLPLLLAVVTAGLLTVAWPEVHAQSVITTIPVGDSPWGVAVNPLTDHIYVANNGSRDVSVIAGGTNAVIATVTVESSASLVAVNPETDRVYVANCNVPRWGACVIDGATNSVVDSLGVTIYRDMAVNPQTNRIYAHTIAGQDDRVTVLDGASHTVLAHVTLGTSQFLEDVAIGVNPQTNRIYVTYSGNNSLMVIDGATNAISATIPLSDKTCDVTVNPETNRVYAIYGKNVAVIDGTTNTIVDTVSGLGTIDDLAVNPQANRIYVGGISKVHVLDGATNNLVATVSGLPSIWDLAANPQTSRVYVTHSSDDIVSVIQDEVEPLPETGTPTVTPTGSATTTPTPTQTTTPATPTHTPTVSPTGTATPPGPTYLPLIVRLWPPIPDIPALHDINNPDGDGNYTVSWSAAARATSYTLEEDDDPAFSSPVTAYSGTSTSKPFTNKAVGTYYYRVKASNSWGDSGWSNTRSVMVLPPTATVEVVNDLSCTLRLTLTGPASYSWSIDANSSRTFSVTPGTYDWSASTSCCGSASGRKTFEAGESYTWRFWCGAAQLRVNF